MVRNQDDVSFLSWTATLHPESATPSSTSSSSGHAALLTGTSGSSSTSPWVTVYHEACAEAFPVATEVVVFDEEQQEFESLSNSNSPSFSLNTTTPSTPSGNPQQQQQSYRENPYWESDSNNDHNNNNNNSGEGTRSSRRTTTTTAKQQQQQQGGRRPQPWKHSNLLDLILGLVMTLVAVISTVKLELTAFLLYLLAAGCFYVAEHSALNSPVYLLLKALLLLITHVFMFLDSILLMISVLITELLGGIALFLCTMFGGLQSGSEWHQFIRRLCHLTRWAFRSCHRGWKPERAFPISMMDDTENENNVNINDEHDDDADESRRPFRQDEEEDDAFHYEGDDENSPRHPQQHNRNPRYTPYTDDATLSTHHPDHAHDAASSSTYNRIDLPPPTTVAMVPIMTSNNMAMVTASATATASIQPAVIAVAPENVSLVHDMDTDDRDQRFFHKNNTQHVEIL